MKFINKKYKMNTKLISLIGAFLFLSAGILFLIVFLLKYDIFSGDNFKLYGNQIAAGVSALWSASGLFFLFSAFVGQQQELKLQHEELELNRTEMKNTTVALQKQKDEMAKQNLLFQKQNFEQSFFSLTGFLNDLSKSSEIENIVSRDYSGLYHDLKRDLSHQNIYDNGEFKTYFRFIQNSSSLFSYYNFVFKIIRFIENSEFDFITKVFYFEITLNMLSQNNLFMLSLYSYSRYNKNDKKSIFYFILNTANKFSLFYRLNNYYDKIFHKLIDYKRSAFDKKFNSNFNIDETY